MSDVPRRHPTGLLVGAMIALVAATVALSAVISSARGNRDIAPVLITGVGGPAAATSPAPEPSPATGGPRIEVLLPAGWTVERNLDEELVLAGPTAVVDLLDRNLDTSATLSGTADDTVTAFQKRYPDARRCQDPHPAAVDGGPSGDTYAICFTDTSAVARAVPADAVIVDALDTVPSGGRHLLSERLIYHDDDADDAMREALPVLRSIHWGR